MLNLDAVKQEKTEVLNSLADSVRNNDEEGMKNALMKWSESVQKSIIDEANSIVDSADSAILSARGIRQLTRKETEFYNKMIKHVKNLGSIDGFEEVWPETIFNDVFDDISENHPLLSYIDFKNTTALTKWIVNDKEEQTAVWGALTSEITEEISGAIAIIDTTMYKLSAYMFMSNDMLDLGPAWVDRYVRELLKGSISTGLETGIVDGTGKDMPIGMTRNVSDDVTVTAGVYPRKPAMAINHLDKETYGSILAMLTKTRTGRTRNISRLIAVVNPVDYFSKIMPATTYLKPDGTYINNVLPYPTTIIQSVGIPEGMMIIGMADKYFAGVSMGKTPKIESSTDFKFLDDMKTFKIKMFATGRAKDNNSFILLDISALDETLPTIITKSYGETKLETLTIGSLTLSPKFEPHNNFYTCETTSATNTITAEAKDSSASVVIKNGSTTVTSGNSATWTAGENIVTITVSNNGDSRTYTVIVTKKS